jgi:hypothetical protein
MISVHFLAGMRASSISIVVENDNAKRPIIGSATELSYRCQRKASVVTPVPFPRKKRASFSESDTRWERGPVSPQQHKKGRLARRLSATPPAVSASAAATAKPPCTPRRGSSVDLLSLVSPTSRTAIITMSHASPVKTTPKSSSSKRATLSRHIALTSPRRRERLPSSPRKSPQKNCHSSLQSVVL